VIPFRFEDIKKTEVLRFAMAICYDGGLLRNSLYLINKKLGIGFSEILEEWERWMGKEYGEIMRIIKGNSGESRKMNN
jgi:hypothetical protein